MAAMTDGLGSDLDRLFLQRGSDQCSTTFGNADVRTKLPEL
jgi:hypothetical protein